MNMLKWIGIGAVVLAGASLAFAQHNWQRTVTVDPTQGAADHQSIQDAIDDNKIGLDPSDRYTVLIYAGEYTEAITLGDRKENVDLVGVDRDAVIIKPPANSDAITIQGDGARSNTIRNLTIITDDDDESQGRGVVVKEQTTGGAPTGVKIVDVTIRCEGEHSAGVYIEDRAEDIEIRGVRMTTTEPASHAVVVSGGTTQDPSKNIRILDSRIATDGGVLGPAGSASDGLHVDDPAEDIEIRNTFIRLDGLGGAVSLDANVSDIDLEKVTVRSTGRAGGMHAASSTRLRMANCDVLQHDGNGIIVGTDTRISNSSIIVDSNFGGDGQTQDDNAGISADGKSGLRVSNSKLRGRREGVRLLGNCTDAVVTNCELIGSHYGAFLECGDEILFQGCLIVGDSAVGMYTGLPVPDYHGVFIDDKDDPNGCEPGEIRFVSCDIRGVSGRTNPSAFGIRAKAAPAGGPVDFIDCTITSRATAAGSPGPNDAKSFGVVADEADAVALIGGSVGSSDADEREPDQFDLLNNAPTGGLGIAASGAKLSKWKGPINAAGRKQSVVQRMLNVAQADPAKLAENADLDGVPIHPGLVGVLGTYRALKATWNNASGDDITITVSGINWTGDDIAEEFELSVGSPAKEGSKPFKIVETIHIPDAPGTISVGTTNKLGLYYPISADSDVLQEARLVSGVYTEQDTGTVDAVYSTVIPSAITTGDSFEWAVLASQ
jgi:hypothetical protein